MGNSIGRLFRVTTFGESHGSGIGVVVDGCPPRLALDVATVQRELDRRRPGQSRLTTQRKEADQVEILSGVHQGVTLGSPIAMLVRNHDTRAQDYADIASAYRPSHADYTYQAKYGVRAAEGGGRASARETVARVAAGAVARIVLAGIGPSTESGAGPGARPDVRPAIEILAWVEQVADIVAPPNPCGPCDPCDSGGPHAPTLEQVEASIVRCPHPETAQRMIERIDQTRARGDSVGGVIRAVARNLPVGLGQPVFDKLEADLAKAMLSLPAAKGFDIGSGFAGATMSGSQHNDIFYTDNSGRVRTRSNHSGGVQGGISNGEDIVLRVAFKPTSTILLAQPTIDTQGQDTTLAPRGRHDPCVLPRAVPIVEAMLAMTLADHLLRHRGQCGG